MIKGKALFPTTISWLAPFRIKPNNDPAPSNPASCVFHRLPGSIPALFLYDTKKFLDKTLIE